MNVLLSWEESSDSEFRSFELGRRLTTFHFVLLQTPGGQIDRSCLDKYQIKIWLFFLFCAFISS